MTHQFTEPASQPNPIRVRVISTFLIYAKARNIIDFKDPEIIGAFEQAEIHFASLDVLKDVYRGQCLVCLKPTSTGQRCENHANWSVVAIDATWSPEEKRRRVVQQLLPLANLTVPTEDTFASDENFNEWINGVESGLVSWNRRSTHGSRFCLECGTEAIRYIRHTNPDDSVPWVKWICDFCFTRANGLFAWPSPRFEPPTPKYVIRPYIYYIKADLPSPSIDDAIALINHKSWVTMHRLEDVVALLTALGWPEKQIVFTLNYGVNGTDRIVMSI